MSFLKIKKFFKGHDTTAMALSYAIILLAENKHAQVCMSKKGISIFILYSTWKKRFEYLD